MEEWNGKLASGQVYITAETAQSIKTSAAVAMLATPKCQVTYKLFFKQYLVNFGQSCTMKIPTLCAQRLYFSRVRPFYE
jgi:hypothetical protein